MLSPRAARQAAARLVALALVLLAALVSAPGTALAVDYPLPTHGDGTVSSSTVHAGGCVVFGGGGFMPGTPITIRDNGKLVGTTHADSSGNFSYKVCFPTNASLGRHVLTADGLGANGAPRRVTAVVYVLGAEVSGGGGGAGQGPGASTGGGTVGGEAGGAGNGGGLPFTGADIRNLVLLGVALVLAGAALTHRGRQAQRARRALRAAS